MELVESGVEVAEPMEVGNCAEDHLTVKGKGDIEKASRCSSMFSTVMLTGLPVENYKHEDVAKLVWKYFPKQSLQSLYYNVMVLTLQRREMMYKSLMKWSNADQEDFTGDVVPSDACHFDEQNFNMDDFVTVDEVGDDVEDRSPEPQSSSSSRQSSRAGRSKRQNSDVSSSGKRTSTRSSKDSSKSTKDSSKSSSVLPKKVQVTPLRSTKSQTKPLSSANGHGLELSQTQNLQIDFNVNTPKDQDKTKQEEREDDKHVEVEEDDIENYQILDSLDDQTDEQMHDGDELTGPKEGQTLQEENYQILDSVDSEGNACPEEDSEMEIGCFFPTC
ncbi:hypothetical protein L3Q82_003963 [Scortum barcoo]|uniref:Uncharacterized protein n=1 Tax=Scortum barcoo TaxID=214431 RepID=A0ACB8X6I8_9TELE|nr:hypothetical protein L3Q82_003963 [Scortum barcoo]